MKKILLLTAALMMAVTLFAQRTISGKVVEQDTQEAVIQATAAILSGEKVVANALTNTNGGFSIKAPRDGRYTLKITYVGFKTYTKQFTIREGKDFHAGTRPIPLYITRARSARPRVRLSRSSSSVCLALRSATTVPSRSMARRSRRSSSMVRSS